MQLNACRGADHGADPAGHCEGDHSDCAAYDKSSCEAESTALGCTWVLDGDDPPDCIVADWALRETENGGRASGDCSAMCLADTGGGDPTNCDEFEANVAAQDEWCTELCPACALAAWRGEFCEDAPAGSCNDATKTTPEGCAGLYDHDGDAATDEIDRVWTADGSHGERGCFADYIRVYV